MTTYTLSLVVSVFDEELLIKTANEHSIATAGADLGDCRDDIAACIQMLLDPGDGNTGYVGDLNAAGIQIEESVCA